MPGAGKKGPSRSVTAVRAVKPKAGNTKQKGGQKPVKTTAKAVTPAPVKAGVKSSPVKAVPATRKPAKKSDTEIASTVSRSGELKKALLVKRDAILNEAKQEIAKYMSGEHRQLIDTAIDEGDWAAIDISEDLNLKRLSAQRQTLLDIEECLRKINEGTYGICEECGEEISIKRLNVLPTARFCIDCKENMERRAALELEPEP